MCGSRPLASSIAVVGSTSLGSFILASKTLDYRDSPVSPAYKKVWLISRSIDKFQIISMELELAVRGADEPRPDCGGLDESFGLFRKKM